MRNRSTDEQILQAPGIGVIVPSDFMYTITFKDKIMKNLKMTTTEHYSLSKRTFVLLHWWHTHDVGSVQRQSNRNDFLLFNKECKLRTFKSCGL